jgi:hypothetical protein
MVSPYDALFHIRHATAGDVKEFDFYLFLTQPEPACADL